MKHLYKNIFGKCIFQFVHIILKAGKKRIKIWQMKHSFRLFHQTWGLYLNWINFQITKLSAIGFPLTASASSKVFVWLFIRVIIPHEERGIEKFHEDEFLVRKSSEENKELKGLKKELFWGKNLENWKKIANFDIWK